MTAPDTASAQRDIRLGLMLALVGTTLFAFKAVLIKLAYTEGATPIAVLVYRMGFSLPIYLVIGAIIYFRAPFRLRAKDLVLCATLGLLSYYVASYLDFTGLLYISAQLERMILFLYPTFVAIMAAVFLGERLTSRVLIALACAYGGVLMLFGHEVTLTGEDTRRGALLVLGAALSFAIYATFAKPLITRLGSRLFIVLAMSSASIAIFVHFAITSEPEALNLTREAQLLVFAMAIFSTVIPSFMMAEAIKRLGATKAGIVGGFGPVATSIFAITLLGEVFTPWHGGGIALAIFGIVLLSRSRSARA